MVLPLIDSRNGLEISEITCPLEEFSGGHRFVILSIDLTAVRKH